MSILNKLVVGSLLIGASGLVSAGSFDTWTMQDSKAKRTTVVVSFTGDGATQEAQLDLDVPEGLELAKAVVKVAGSVCAAIPGNKIRVVPPSGAGEALSSRAVDYCSFSFRSNGALSKAKPEFKVSFQECATTTGASACTHQTSDITQ